MSKVRDAVPSKVLAFIRARRLLAPGDRVVVAVSGGPDSVCLLHLLAGLAEALEIELYAAHLDHQLRDEASAADADYVAGLAARLRIPAVIGSRDVRAYRAQRRLTLEEAAREVRYAFLGEVARKLGGAKVAVGHTANDHIETILMHLIRGTGLRGLRGLLPAAAQQASGLDLEIIRPLLELTREETEAYCAAHGLEPRLDASNLSLEPFRNRVRRRLLPELQEYNPRIGEALARTARTAADGLDFIERAARRAFGKLVTPEKGAVVMDKKGLLKLHPAIQRQVLRLAIESLLGSLKDIEASHIEDSLQALDGPAGKVIGLPFGLNFYVDYNRYILASGAAELCPFPALEKAARLNVPGKTLLPGWEVAASIIPPGPMPDEDGFTACLDAVKAGKQLTVRCRRPGDRFQPLGMNESKRLNRFMMDAHIPQAWRGRVPLVCAGDGVLWVAGWRIGELYRVRPETLQILRLEFKRV